ncbi:MAG: Glutathione synthetase, partial [Pseudomonadota bacterium]
IVEGDKRILLIDGEPVPHALARIPPAGASRGNLAAGGRAHVQPLTARDQAIAADLGPILAARGLFLVGLDVIGEHLTEINVTSPTGFQEITRQTGFDVAAHFITRLEGLL